MVRLSCKFVNFGNVKLGSCYVVTATVRVSASDRGSGASVVVTQPECDWAWVSLRGSTSVKDRHLKHTWLIDVFLKASQQEALETAFTVGRQPRAGLPDASVPESDDDKTNTVTVPIVANVVSPVAFERLYRHNPDWTHANTGGTVNKALRTGTVRVASSTCAPPEDKSPLVIHAATLYEERQFERTLVPVANRYGTRYFEPLPSFAQSPQKPRGAATTPISMPSAPTPDRAGLRVPARPARQSALPHAPSPREKVGELRGASRPRAGSSAVPKARVGRPNARRASNSVNDIRPFDSPRAAGVPERPPRFPARAVSDGDAPQDVDEADDTTPSVVSPRSHDPSRASDRPVVLSSTMDGEEADPVAELKLRQQAIAEQSSHTLLVSDSSAHNGADSGEYEYEGDESLASSASSLALSGSDDGTESRQRVEDLLTVERFDKLLRLLELHQKQLALEERAKVEAQLEAKRLRAALNEQVTRLQAVTQSDMVDATAASLIRVSTAGSVTDPAKAGELHAPPADNSASSLPSSRGQSLTQSVIGALNPYADSSDDEEGLDDRTQRRLKQLRRNPLVQHLMKRARVQAVAKAERRVALQLSITRWRFAGAAAVAVRWRHKCLEAEREVERLSAEYSALYQGWLGGGSGSGSAGQLTRVSAPSSVGDVDSAPTGAVPTDSEGSSAVLSDISDARPQRPPPVAVGAVTPLSVSPEPDSSVAGEDAADEAETAAVPAPPPLERGMTGLAETYATLLMEKEGDIQEQQDEIQALRTQLAAARDQHVLHDRMMRTVLLQLAEAQSSAVRQEEEIGREHAFATRLHEQLRDAQQRVRTLAKVERQRRASIADLLVQRRASVAAAAPQPTQPPVQPLRPMPVRRRRKRPGRSSLLSMYSLPSVSTARGRSRAAITPTEEPTRSPEPQLKSALMTLTAPL